MNASEIKVRALEYAKEEYHAGAGEIGENNSGPYIEKYLHNLIKPPVNWCMAFMSWCYYAACDFDETKMPFKYSISAKSTFNEFKHKSWLIKLDEVQPGDLIFFWREPETWMGHVGVVINHEKIEIDFTYVQTIEGNKGKFPAKVDIYIYDKNNIPQLLGFGRVQ